MEISIATSTLEWLHDQRVTVLWCCACQHTSKPEHTSHSSVYTVADTDLRTYMAAHSTNNLTLLHTCVIAQDPTRTQLLGYLLYHAARQLVPISTTSHQKSVLLQSRLHQHADSLNDDYIQTSYLRSLVSFLLMYIRVYITACIIQKVREVMNCIVNESLIRFGEQLIQCISSQRWLCIVWDTG